MDDWLTGKGPIEVTGSSEMFAGLATKGAWRPARVLFTTWVRMVPKLGSSPTKVIRLAITCWTIGNGFAT